MRKEIARLRRVGKKKDALIVRQDEQLRQMGIAQIKMSAERKKLSSTINQLGEKIKKLESRRG